MLMIHYVHIRHSRLIPRDFISSLLVLVPDFTRYPYKPYIDPYSRRAGFRYMYIWLGLNLWIESGLPKSVFSCMWRFITIYGAIS